MEKIKEFFVKFYKKYKPEILKGALGVVAIIILFWVFPGVLSTIAKFGKNATDMNDGYWFATFQNLFIFLFMYAVWRIGWAYMRRLWDKKDDRFEVSHVGTDPVANGIYAGLIFAASIVSEAVVFVSLAFICLK